MIFQRTILSELSRWKQQANRKPLILRGARQVGKTTAINVFGKSFDYFLSFNLEIATDRHLFETIEEPENLMAALLFSRSVPANSGQTLIFIDEIQQSPKAVSQMRYFHELFPQYFFVAAGSLLETAIGRNISFPVGRVEFRAMRPLSFTEFLDAFAEKNVKDILQTFPFPSFAHDILLNLFRQYTFIGGMPEVVSKYIETRDLIRLQPIYESLLVSYIEDVEKYAPNELLKHVLSFLIRRSFLFAATRIKFQGFGKSNYGSKEVGEAFRLLEKTMLLRLVYPSVETKPPLVPDLRKSPRLQFLDTGLVNYVAGLQENLFGQHQLNEIYEGRIIEHVAGQELLAQTHQTLAGLNFWVREKRQSQSEVDYLYPYKGRIIPIEVKSGPTGHLRSLHLFIDAGGSDLAVRIYTGHLKIEQHQTISGHPFTLLNLPCYLISELDRYLEGNL